MIVLVGNCLNGLCQKNNVDHPLRGGQLSDTIISVPINMIKAANSKIIKGKLYKAIVEEQDSIIKLQKFKYQALNHETIKLQQRLDNSNKVNDNLNKSIERIKRTNKYLVGGGAICTIAFIVYVLVK